MLHHPQSSELPAPVSGVDPVLQRLTPCDDGALSRLTSAFNNARPAAIVIGKGYARSGRVIDNFLAAIDDKTSVVRITTPSADATSCMQSVVGSVGFESSDFSLVDLEKIFTMFLCHQRTHKLRTVLCIENAQDCDSWVIDEISKLTDLEAQEKFGLFVIISGQRALKEMQHEMPLQRIAAHAGRDITVSPLRLNETRQFVLQQIQSGGAEDVGDIIQFEAITRLHEIGEGVADTVSGLCAKSLQLAQQGACYPITEDTISEAAFALGLGAGNPPPVAVAVDEVIEDSRCVDRLILTLNGIALGECALDSDCISIGRDRNNSVCIPSGLVSRHHVLIAVAGNGAKIMDLGSTNGMLVNGTKVHSHVLQNGDNIKLGDCEIEYCSS